MKNGGVEGIATVGVGLESSWKVAVREPVNVNSNVAALAGATDTIQAAAAAKKAILRFIRVSEIYGLERPVLPLNATLTLI